MRAARSSILVGGPSGGACRTNRLGGAGAPSGGASGGGGGA